MKLQEHTSLTSKNHYFQTGDSKIDDTKSFDYIYKFLKQQSDGTFYVSLYMINKKNQSGFLLNYIIQCYMLLK